METKEMKFGGYMTTDDYTPFDDGIIFQTQGYSVPPVRCEYCNKPSNSGFHHKWCPYTQPNANNVTAGSEMSLIVFLGVYLLIKSIKSK